MLLIILENVVTMFSKRVFHFQEGFSLIFPKAQRFAHATSHRKPSEYDTTFGTKFGTKYPHV